MYKPESTSLLGVDDAQLVSHQPLTEEALRKHEALTSFHQFSCQACQCDWWSDVPVSKEVSRCKCCNIRYDALPRDMEYGVGHFTCPNENCGKVFFNVCNAKSKYNCLECGTKVSGPFLHPSNEKSYKTGHAAHMLGVLKKQYSSYSGRHISPVFARDTEHLKRDVLSDSSGTRSSVFYYDYPKSDSSFSHYRHTNIPPGPASVLTQSSSYHSASPNPTYGYYFKRGSSPSSSVNVHHHFPRSASLHELTRLSNVPVPLNPFRRTASSGYYEPRSNIMPMNYHRRSSHPESLASSACSSRG